MIIYNLFLLIKIRLDWALQNFKSTGKSFSEALILASTNPQCDKRLFIELPAQHIKITITEIGQNMARTCSALVVFMYLTGKSMNNRLPYRGLVDARISASEKDLPYFRE